MALKPWYKIVTPREDLREGKPLDASEFAVHLDQVRDGRAPVDYQNPGRFFERTYLTTNLSTLAVETIRRLSGETTQTSAVFNLATQFGGGKTHALTLLYHLATGSPQASSWHGVPRLIEAAGVKTILPAATAVFVGTEFDSLTGRGGSDGTPLRKTPWGEIAFQLGGAEGFAFVAEHEAKMIAPAGDVIRQFLPPDRPCMILLDELMNYVSRNRKSGLATQLYDFLQNLSETARGQKNMVLAVSIPASELEMTADDHLEYERLKKLLDRLGKAIILSAESETAEIIRRRLFEWYGLPAEARRTAAEFAAWVMEHRHQVPASFPVDHAQERFEATYPFHPMVLSVFERKWQMLPRFQQTRGILRLLALWVSKAYQEGFKSATRDPLIGLGTAPLDDPNFRAAAFEQLGGSRLEGAVTTDIAGGKDAFAVRLDKEAAEDIRKGRLHRKAATIIFFESNGGQLRAEATVPEIRMAVAEPDLDIGHVETVLESLAVSCHFLMLEGNKYRFSITPNLNKLLADRVASVSAPAIKDRIRSEIQGIFSGSANVERVFFPEKSNQIPDRPALTLIILPPDQALRDDPNLLTWLDTMTREYGTSARTFKSALIWAVPETSAHLQEEARKLLAWESIQHEDIGKLDESQKKQLAENLGKAKRDLKECVWRTYKNLVLLGKDNALRTIDLGLVHSSAAPSLVTFMITRLRQDGDVEEAVSPNFLARNWPPAFTEWSTKSVRDAFYASPKFPRLMNPEAVKDTVAKGVNNKLLAYVGKSSERYDPFFFGTPLCAHEVEISEEMFIITKETAEAYLKAQQEPAPPPIVKEPMAPPPTLEPTPPGVSQGQPIVGGTPSPGALTPPGTATPTPLVPKLTWTGEIPAQKWMNFYTKVLARFASGGTLKIQLKIEINQPTGISSQKIEETSVALRELGLEDTLKTD